MSLKYPVYNCSFRGNEKTYVNDCLDSTWISSKGSYIQKFEQKFAEYIDIPHAVTVNNGTAALHLALLALDIKPGDEVIVPTFTYVASINAIAYMNAIPVFVDSEKDYWQMDPKEIEKKITGKTRAILAVHLYGHPCNMDKLLQICNKYQLFLVEDCAEAIGSKYKGRYMGTFGDISAFSFFGNKTITTGEGGMIVTASEDLCNKAKLIKNQGVASKMYWHDIMGYNYRMTNICAAIGLAQLEKVEEVLTEKIRIANTYRKLFANTEIEFHSEEEGCFHSYWMCCILIKDAEKRDNLREYLLNNEIETRPLFYPCNTLPMYKHLSSDSFPIASNLAYRGVNLPSYPELTMHDLEFISNKVIDFVYNHG
jgi:perosamine synthetase